MSATDEAALQLLLHLEELADEEEEEEEAHRAALLGLAALVYGSIWVRERRNAIRRMTRQTIVRANLLVTPHHSTPWHALYESRDDRAFITTMTIDTATFQLILDSGFSNKWNTMSIPRHDLPGTAPPVPRRRSLDAAGALGLCLHYLTSTMLDVSLMQIFAIIPSTVSRYLDFGLNILLETLLTMPAARIRWLRGDEFQERNALITERHPLLTGAFGSMDGLNLPVQSSADTEIENATYNGWLSEHFVSCVFAFCSKGEIIGGRINAPGSWHDSRVAKPLYEKLRIATPIGWYLVTDTAFPRGNIEIEGRIKAPMKQGTRLSSDPTVRQQEIAFDHQLLSYRQTAEWGMRAIQGAFGRVRVPLPSENVHRRVVILELVMRLHNLRTRLVGINQIRSVYEPIWKEGDQDRVWKNFEEMLFGEQRKRDRVTQYHSTVVFREA